MPKISRFVKVSPIKINADIATMPGVKTNNGRALLNSKFFIPSIIQKNEPDSKADLTNKTISPDEEIWEKSTKKKKGIAIIKLNIERINVNESAFSLNKTFFWAMAADAENSAEINARKYQEIIL